MVAGDQVDFDVLVDNPVSGGPYAVADVDSVTYLLFDASGELLARGPAEAQEDGLWRVSLPGETTGGLKEGASRLDVVVVSKLVALPALSGLEFLTVP